MAKLPPYPDSNEDTGVEPDRESTTGAPRWVSVFVTIVAIVLVLLFVVLHLTGTVGPGGQ